MRRRRDPRIGVFELALRTGESSDAEKTLELRHEYWASLQQSGAPTENDGADYDGAAAVLFVELPLYILIAVGALGFTALAIVLNVVVLLLAIPLVLVMTISSLVARSKNVRTKFDATSDAGLYKIIAEGRCVECQYDVSGCRDEYEIASSVALGPRRCPECGALWPRVPAPTLDEMHHWHRSWFVRR